MPPSKAHLCLACGGSAFTAFPRSFGTSLALCRGCGLLSGGTASPHAAEPYALAVDSAAVSDTMRRRAAEAWAWLSPRVRARSAILEIGSADINILAPLRAHAGVEIDALDAFSIERGRVEVFVRDAAAWRATGLVRGGYGVVLIGHTLQCCSDPAEVLALARHALTDDGVLLLEVSNLLAPPAHKRLSTWLRSQQQVCFTERRLRELLDGAGFEVERFEAGASLRALAVPSAAARQQTLPSDVGRVLAALVVHELRYWPAHVAKRLRREIDVRWRTRVV